MSTLKIFIYGLMAFVPTIKDSQPGMTVLMTDAFSNNVSNGCALAPHHAFVAFEAGACSGNDCKWEAIGFKRDKKPKFSGSWNLNKEDFVVGYASGAVVGNRPSSPPAGSIPSSKSEAKAFSWIADMGKILDPIKAPLKKSCLGDGKGCDILGRFEIPSGEVQTCHLAQDPEIPYTGFVHAFDFQRLLGGKSAAAPQALADVVYMELPLSGSLEVSTHAFGSKDKTRSVMLSPDQGEIRLYVLDIPTPYDASHCSGHAIADHFERFYGLVDGPADLPNHWYVPMQTSEFTKDDIQPGTCVAADIHYAARTKAQRADIAKGARLDPHSPRVPPVCPPVVIDQ